MTARVSTEPAGGTTMGREPALAVSDDAVLARILAEAAGAVLLGVRRTGTSLDPARLRDAGDAAAQHLLAERLAAQRPDDAVLSEEAVDDRRRLGAERVWIIDPLDGTREFAEGRPDWATARRCATTSPTFCCPTWSSAVRSSPSRSWRQYRG